MTWAEFRDWALSALGYHIDPYPFPSSAPGAAWRAIWGDGESYPFASARTLTGSGNPAIYGLVQQRRLAIWIRGRSFLNKDVMAEWLKHGEVYHDGWLVNDGEGIRWVADPEPEVLDLIRRGFVAVKCGL